MQRLRPELIAELACATTAAQHFEREVLGLLDRHIGADVSFFSGAGGVSEVALGLDPSVRPRAQRRWRQMRSEVARLLTPAQSAGGVVVDSEWFGAELKRLVYYDTFMRPHRGRTTLIGFLRYHDRFVGKLVLGRSEGSSPFRERDVAAVRELIPTLSLSQHGYAARPPAAPVPAPQAAAGDLARLSEREREVMGYLHLGYTNQQIALALGSAPRTVRNQLSRAYDKLGVSSRAEAVAAWHGTNVPWSRSQR